MHPKHDDHCFYGCSKCGGCFFNHKRNKLIRDGKRPCMHPKHPFAVHLHDHCALVKAERAKHGTQHNGGRRQPSYNKKHSNDNRRSNNHGRHRSPDRSHDRYRKQDSHGSNRKYDARSAQPKYFRQVQDFAHSRSRSRSPHRDRNPRTRSRSPPRGRHSDRRSSPRPLRSPSRSRSRPRRNGREHAKMDVNNQSIQPSRNSSARTQRHAAKLSDFRVHEPRSDHESNGRMAGMYMPGKNDDGLYDYWIHEIPECKHFSKIDPQQPTNANRLVVGAANAGVKRRRMTVMDSGAGRPMFDDEELYAPRSKREVNADVVWGDGSTRKAAFEGSVGGPLEGCINTGGALESNLMSVGSSIDSLQRKYNRKICMLFDEGSTYIFKDVVVVPSTNRKDRFTIRSDGVSNGMRAATRTPNSSEVYRVPLAF